MQNENYRTRLMEVCQSIFEELNHLFQCGMELTFCDELKEVSEVMDQGEDAYLPWDTLDTMKDPLVREIGRSITESRKMFYTIVYLNNFEEEDTCVMESESTPEEKERTKTEAEQFSALGPEQRYKEIIRLMKANLITALCEIISAKEELADPQEFMRMADFIKTWETNQYRERPEWSDRNLILLSEIENYFMLLYGHIDEIMAEWDE